MTGRWPGTLTRFSVYGWWYGLPVDDRHPLLRRGHHVLEPDAALDVAAVPDRRARRGQAQDADRDRLVAGHLHALERVRRRVGQPCGLVDDVRAEHRVVDGAGVGVQQVQAVVELVIADDLRVVADGVVRGGHGVLDTGLGDRLLLGVVVGQRGPLQEVPVVDDEDAVRTAGLADRVDDRADPRQAGGVTGALGVRRVLEVVPVLDPAVQVGGRQHGELERVTALRSCGRGCGGTHGQGQRDRADRPCPTPAHAFVPLDRRCRRRGRRHPAQGTKADPNPGDAWEG